MNDETLILYYYNDGMSEAERRRIAAALEVDAALRARYAVLCGELDALRAPPTVTPPPDMVARFHGTIERAATLDAQHTTDRNPASRFHLLSFTWGGIVAAAIVAGIGIGFYLGRDNTAVEPTAAPIVAAQSDAFARGLKVHLARSNQDIASMPLDTASDRSMLLLHIIQQNRIFELAAEQNDAPDLARVLRAFEPILLELASDETTPERATALRAQLQFELNVVLTKLSRDTSEQTDTV